MASVKITGIFPKRANLIDQTKLKREVNGALDRTGKLIRGDFRNTTKTWKTKLNGKLRAVVVQQGVQDAENGYERLPPYQNCRQEEAWLEGFDSVKGE